MGPVTGPTASPARLPSFRAPGSGATSIVSIRYGDVLIGMATYRSKRRRTDRNGDVSIGMAPYRCPSARPESSHERSAFRASEDPSRADEQAHERSTAARQPSCRPPSRRQSFLSAPEDDAWKRTGGFSDRLADGRDRLTRHIAPHSRRAIAAPGRAPGFRRERARDSAKRSDNRPRPRRSGGSGGTSRPCDRSSASSRRVTG